MCLTVKHISHIRGKSETPKHEITVDTALGSWLAGTVDGLPYAVKVCDVKSEFGIDNGHVIKLYLFAADGEREIVTYERGWAKYPAGRYEDSMDALIAYCEALPPAGNRVVETGEPH